MRRREFLGFVGCAAVFPPVAHAQQAVTPVIGFLSSRSSDVDAQLVDSFHRGLAQAGFFEGRNVEIEYRWAHGRYERLPTLAAELVNRPVAVLVSTGGTVSALAAKASTKTIPVVFTTADDPVKVGLVNSLNRPGGNVTGITASFIETAPKRIGLLHELLPKATRLAFLVNPTNPAAITESGEMRPAAQSAGLQIEILNASSTSSINVAFEDLKKMQVDAVIIAADPFFFSQAEQLVTLAARQGIATLYFRREFAVSGGLMSYGSNFAEFFRVVGEYAGRILKGAAPGDLPVQRPTKFELVINLKSAKALGITVPVSLIARADEVIEVND
jgi:putative ABC transport system substrate-binding protein